MAESDVTDNPKLFGVRGLVAAWSTSAAAFAGFSLLLPVVPWAIAQEGGSDTVAGSVTAVFMFTTVLTQIAMPALLRRFGHRATLVAGCLFLGPPSLLFLVSMEPAAALGISAIRGIGFGMITVASAALVGELAPARLLGRATGMLGIAIAASQMIGLPTGLALAERFSTTPVFVLGAVLSSAGLIAAARLPRLEARTGPRPARMPFVLLLLPTVAVGAGAIAYGGLTSLLAIAVADLPVAAALAVLSGSTLVGRFGAGAVADRIGAGRMLPVGLALAALAMVPFALVADGRAGAVALIGAAVSFGLGFGVVQNEALLIAFRRAGSEHIGSASAAWNIGFDAGTGAGSFALGAIAAASGYPTAFTVAAVLVPVLPLLARLAGPSERPGVQQVAERPGAD
ncbi:MFS transporter [Rhodococcus sp. (in: high G+C Gram-positive bacteria)]|uniref:MFS transporter n=1 Tax=unclassified Rhodococcus (in: high G+C Gram-positive bacteria) TaxID=192944 RepID=UPI0025DA226B|nr:MFS transporter [Rhodococcus sp. (in: high G+C Gram-positive bacteria)]